MDPSPGAHDEDRWPLDASQQRAFSLFETGANVALLGRAGCGKSLVMRRMVSKAIERHGREAVAVTALSGSAAQILSGQTLHSLFGMDTRPLSREAWLRETLRRPQVCRRLSRLRVLFIDEICTVPSSLFSRLGYVMRRVAPPHMQHLPFAGCQLVCAGDPLQVVPVKVTESSVDRMVFQCASWRDCFERAAGKVICLTGSHRQRDVEFQRVLDRLRWGRVDAALIQKINATGTASIAGSVTQLRIKKSSMQLINEERLAQIESPSVVFTATDEILTNDQSLVETAVSSLRSSVDLTVVLKRDALVILTRKLGDTVPGSRGVVKRFISAGDQGGSTVTEVECDFDGKLVVVGRSRFSAYNSSGTELAFCEQLPLLLGWAITVHRAQGFTLDAVQIDFQLDTWTTAGLVYAALSRVRSFSSLCVKGLRRDLIQVSRCSIAYYERQLAEDNIDPEEDGRPPIEP